MTPHYHYFGEAWGYRMTLRQRHRAWAVVRGLGLRAWAGVRAEWALLDQWRERWVADVWCLDVRLTDAEADTLRRSMWGRWTREVWAWQGLARTTTPPTVYLLYVPTPAPRRIVAQLPYVDLTDAPAAREQILQALTPSTADPTDR